MESAPSGWSQVFWVGVSVESALSHWSQLLQLESAWSQVFWVGVSLESALSHWSQPLQLESAWSQQLRSLHARASWSGMEPAAPARSGSLRVAPQRSERSCVGAGVGVLVMWALCCFVRGACDLRCPPSGLRLDTWATQSPSNHSGGGLLASAPGASGKTLNGHKKIIFLLFFKNSAKDAQPNKTTILALLFSLCNKYKKKPQQPRNSFFCHLHVQEIALGILAQAQNHKIIGDRHDYVACLPVEIHVKVVFCTLLGAGDCCR